MTSLAIVVRCGAASASRARVRARVSQRLASRARPPRETSEPIPASRVPSRGEASRARWAAPFEPAGRTTRWATTTTTSTTSPPRTTGPSRKDDPLNGRPLGVVLTHVQADFDTLSSAVGLAKLRNARLGAPCTFVVLPRGASPGVSHYLALHKNKFPIKEKRTLPVERLEWVGVVDAQRRDRPRGLAPRGSTSPRRWWFSITTSSPRSTSTPRRCSSRRLARRRRWWRRCCRTRTFPSPRRTPRSSVSGYIPTPAR